MYLVRFKAYDVVRLYKGYQHKTLLYCGYCGQTMAAVFPYMFNWRGAADLSSHYTCPHCGRGYTDDRTVGDIIANHGAIPLVVELSVKEYKHFVDFNIKYEAVMYNQNTDDLYKAIEPRFESIRFDCKYRRVLLRSKIGGRARFMETVILPGEVPAIVDKGLSNHVINRLDGLSNVRKHRKQCAEVMAELRKTVVSCLEKHTGYPVRDTYHPINTNDTRFFGKEVLGRLILKTYAPDAPVPIASTSTSRTTAMRNTWDTYLTVFRDTMQGKAYIDAVEGKLVKQPSKAKRIAIMADALNIEAIYLAEQITDNKDYQDQLITALRPYLGMELLPEFLTDYATNRSPRNVLQFLARYEGQDDGWRMVRDTAGSYRDINDKSLVWGVKIKPADMHDKLAQILAKEESKNVPLKDNSALDARIYGFDFIAPRMSHDLIDLGTALHNCVANYKKRVINGECAIVAALKDGRPVVCIEIRGDEIVQAKLVNNKGVYTSESEEVKNAVYQYMDVKGLRDTSRDLRS